MLTENTALLLNNIVFVFYVEESGMVFYQTREGVRKQEAAVSGLVTYEHGNRLYQACVADGAVEFPWEKVK